jgi:hypothetical protein
MPGDGHRRTFMHPSTWAGNSFERLLELLAGAIAALNPALIVWSIVLVVVITVAINSTMKRFVKQTPQVRRDIIKLAKALRRRSPKP